MTHRFSLAAFGALAAGSLLLAMQAPHRGAAAPEHWWRGNLHTHSLWSDGNDYPEMIARNYKEAGYHFLALSDHNILAEGERWFDIGSGRGGGAVLQAYRAAWGDSWVERRTEGGKELVRLKPLPEYRSLLEEPGRFLMIPSEEISAAFEKRPIHLNATNIKSLIPPQTGNSVAETIQNNIDAVLKQRAETGQPMFPHLNHPNFGWAVTVEDMLKTPSEQFFEVYNGHPAVHNYGSGERPGMERFWDILLSFRLARGDSPLFGLAVDDAHNHHDFSPKQSNPFRGWVQVRAAHLTPASIVTAMERGDFYASTGVTLSSLKSTPEALEFRIAPEPGVTYVTEFIGTRKGFDTSSSAAAPDSIHPNPASRKYSSDIGVVLATVQGPEARYRFKGDELYVRARVTSSKLQKNPYKEGDTERAWIQPARPGKAGQENGISGGN